ncbi:FAD-dependent oxidoreductase [Halegenticoccus soli]|uniref:FAD-dependent oxidoreductase n=1 Tax=Halegenticoccus soli TaxID=1985678 RepID=UPI000C6EFE14|nr:FAD-dependent oxidoreductase [Halegenticoccus soli]
MGDTFVVVGGDAAGMSAASKAKRDAPEMDVVAFEKGNWVSYSACGMPYYIEGSVESLSDLVAVDPREFVEERGIDLRLRHEVVGIDPERRTVAVRGEGGEFEQPYDALLIATGARATVPPVDGTDLGCVFTLRSLDEARTIRKRVEDAGADPDREPPGSADPDEDVAAFLLERDPTTVGVVGGGYVGLELADALHARGLDVHLFQRSEHVLSPYADTVAEVVEDHLRERGVTLHLGSSVTGLAGDTDVAAIETADGSVPVDMAVVGTGVVPNVELAADAGVTIGGTGAIATDPYNRTNLDDVYAAGDCAEVENVITDAPTYVPLALTANRHGRAVGSTVAGRPTKGGGVVGTAVAKVVELEVARTGITDLEEAREAGFDPVERTITTGSRASYDPGRAPITIQMVADAASGRLLGASMAGTDRVAKRIDTVATALHAGMTLDQVERLDLAYAPPFSPVWDPVLTAAKVLNGALGRDD